MNNDYNSTARWLLWLALADAVLLQVSKAHANTWLVRPKEVRCQPP